MTHYREIQVGGHRGNSRRGVALVDAVDAEAVCAYCWSMNSDGYAVRYTQVGGKQTTVRMHREILGLGPGDPREVDHINGDTLDNRRENLRGATKAQNAQNLHWCGPHRGATWRPEKKRWLAKVCLDGRQRHLGYFDTREEAAAVAAAWRRQHMPYSSDAQKVATEEIMGVEDA